MKLIKPSFEILTATDQSAIIAQLRIIELAGRNCYKSENLITDDSYSKIIAMLRMKKHESVLEHGNITVRLIGSRAMTHQLVRHRIAAYSQESQRYCSYNKGKFNNEITFIEPEGYALRSLERRSNWVKGMEAAESAYFEDIRLGGKPEEAREHLPNACKTEIVVTMNLRSWRHFFEMRCDPHAQAEIRNLALSLLEEFYRLMPVVFSDLNDRYSGDSA